AAARRQRAAGAWWRSRHLPFTRRAEPVAGAARHREPRHPAAHRHRADEVRAAAALDAWRQTPASGAHPEHRAAALEPPPAWCALAGLEQREARVEGGPAAQLAV